MKDKKKIRELVKRVEELERQLEQNNINKESRIIDYFMERVARLIAPINNSNALESKIESLFKQEKRKMASIARMLNSNNIIKYSKYEIRHLYEEREAIKAKLDLLAELKLEIIKGE